MGRMGIVSALVAVVAASCTWGMVGHDGGRTSADALDTKLTPANVGGLHELWRATPGARPSAPVAAGGRVFVTTQPSGTTAGALESFDAAGAQSCTGAAPAQCTPQWTLPMFLPQSGDLPAVGPPIASGGRVWAGATGFDLDLLPQLIPPYFTVAGGYDPATGARTANSSISRGYPAESGGVRYGYAENNFTNTFTSGLPRFLSYPSIVAAADDGSGSHTVLINPPSGGIAVVGDRLYLGVSGRVEVYDTNPATVPCGPGTFGVPDGFFPAYACTPLWSAVMTHTGSLDGLPTVANGLLYVSEVDGGVEVFDAAGCGAPTCAPRWTARAGTQHVGEVAVTGTTLYVPSDDGHLYAFPSTGCGSATCEPSWSVDVGSAVHAPALAGALVFTGTQDGRLVAFSAGGCGGTSCSVLRSVAVGAALRRPIAVSDGRVAAVTDDGVLHGLGVA